MRIVILSLICIFLSQIKLLGQENDKIYLKSKELIEGKVLKVNSESIEIDPIGDKPFLIIPRENVEILIYSDNTVVNFNTEQKSNTDLNKRPSPVSFSKTNHFKINFNPEKIGKSRQAIEEYYIFNDSINNKTIKVKITGGFKHSDFKKDLASYRYVCYIETLALQAEIEVNGVKNYTTLLHINDEKDHRHRLTGWWGEVVIEAEDNIPMGDYLLGYSLSRIDLEDFYIKLTIRSY